MKRQSPLQARPYTHSGDGPDPFQTHVGPTKTWQTRWPSNRDETPREFQTCENHNRPRKLQKSTTPTATRGNLLSVNKPTGKFANQFPPASKCSNPKRARTRPPRLLQNADKFVGKRLVRDEFTPHVPTNHYHDGRSCTMARGAFTNMLPPIHITMMDVDAPWCETHLR